MKSSKPKSGRASAFGPDDDWANNACLGFDHFPWSGYAMGYKEAADVLVQHVKKDGFYIDALVYPIAFLYRQSLELALKTIIRKGGCLFSQNKPSFHGHRLDKLWPNAKKVIHRLWPEMKDSELSDVEQLLQEFSAIDPRSQSFRYPEDKKGKKVLSDVRHINLRRLSEKVGPVFDALDGVDTALDSYIDVLGEMAEEYR